MIAPTVDQRAQLKQLVTRYRVCWDVWPEYVYVASKRRQIGFELELSGTHEPNIEHPSPGCEHCRRVFLALVETAEWILPRETRPTRYDLEPYETKIHYSQVRNSRPDVSLSMKILHRQGGFDPVDACEVRCLSEMQQRLREVGACQGRWVAGRKEQP